MLRVLSICGDYDEAHRCLLSVNGQSTKCSAYVADVCKLFALHCIRSVLVQDRIHRMISLSGCSDLIGNNCKALTGFTSSCSFDRSVKGKQISLCSNIQDRVSKYTNLVNYLGIFKSLLKIYSDVSHHLFNFLTVFYSIILSL